MNDVVYIVQVDNSFEYNYWVTFEVFSTKEKAKEYFDKVVQEKKESDHLLGKDSPAINESDTYFEIYEGYHEDNFRAQIIEKTIS